MEIRTAVQHTDEYIQAAVDQMPDPEKRADGLVSRSGLDTVGLQKIVFAALSHPVFRSHKNDSFVLQHDDLDLQNILTDSEGNITGILDWDGSLAMPRCIGHAAVPKFLRRDWFPNSDALFDGQYLTH